MTVHIHPTAIVSPQATLDEGVKIGPYCYVGEHATLGRGVTLHSHVVVEGWTTIGEGAIVFPFASLGHAPQDLKYKGEPSTVHIGAHTIIREYVTIQPGTIGGSMATNVGDHCLLMAGAHVAHDCTIGNHVVMANSATLGGHVSVGDHAIIGGLAAVHQFVRIGHHAIISGMAGVKHDVIPYGAVLAKEAPLAGLNVIGLKRSGMPREHIDATLKAYEMLFESAAGTLLERVAYVGETYPDQPAVQEIINFIKGDSARALCMPR